MATNPPTHFALRPWPQGSRKPGSLGEFIARVNAERGGFRNVTEEALLKEAEARPDGDVDSAEAGMSVDSDAEDAEDAAEAAQLKVEDMHAARAEVAKNAELAHQNAMLALDFVSLLLSKETPVQASSTLSPALRELVGIGTLGADKLAASRLSDAQLQDNKLVSTGWKLSDISKTVNSVLSSAARLEEEIGLETRYWAEVLSVSDSGWSVTRVPQERHTLGVRYGFLESGPEFRSRSLAPMRRSDTGDVALDCGRAVVESQRLCVAIERDGRVVGRSSLQKPLAAGAPLEERVREARDTVFAQELWHEMNREARSLLAYNVRLEDSQITYQIDEESRMVFSLENLGGEGPDEAGRSHAEDDRAETMSLLLNLLLSHAHRQNNHRRSKPALANRNPPSPAPYSLLRPVIGYLMHEQAVARLVRFVSELTGILRRAGVGAARFELREAPIAPSPSALASRSSPSEALVYSLLGPLEFQVELTTLPEARVLIHGRTLLLPVSSTSYHVHLLPPAAATPGPDPASAEPPPANPLHEAFPPSDSPQGYPDLLEVLYYLRQAVPRALAQHFEPLAPAWDAEGGRGSGSGAGPGAGPGGAAIKWARTINGAALWDVIGEAGLARFEVAREGDRDRPAEADEEEAQRPQQQQQEGRDERRAAGAAADRPLELRLYGRWYADKKVHLRKWTWSAGDARAARPGLEEMVRGVVQRKPREW